MLHIRTLIVFIVVSILSFHAFAGNEVTVEWAPFVIKDGVTNEHLIRAAQNVEENFLKNQKGYIKRALLKGKEGGWVDIVYWKSEEDAKKAATAAYTSPICFDYFALMKGAEQSEVSNVQHFQVIKSWH